MSLENLEKRLSDFKTKSSDLARHEEKNKPNPILEKVWEIEEHLEDDHRWLKRVLLAGSGMAFLIVGLGLFFIFSYTSGSRDVALELNSAGEVSRGAPFNIDVSVTNNSGAPIKKAVITLNLPQGIIVPGSSRDRGLVTESIGDVVSGNLVKRSYALVPVEKVGVKKTVAAVLSYEIATGARFEVRQTQTVAISHSAIKMEIKKPDQVLSGSNFSIKIDYKNSSDFNFPSLTLAADYPNAFKFDSASVPPASLNNYWQLGSLVGGGKKTLAISGHLDLSSGANAVMPIKISVNFGGQDYPIAEEEVNLSPAAPPLSLQILVNKRTGYVSYINDTLNYSIQYQNLSGIALADTQIKAVLTGEMLDISSLKTDGAFDPNTQTLSWNSSNLPALRILDPGASGEVNFRVNVKNAFNLQRLNDRNFSIRLSVTIDSPSVPYYLSASRTSVQGVSDTKIAGLVLVNAQGAFNDGESGIINKGSLPPRVGQATEYTIHWLIKNFATDLNNAEVRAQLAPGVKWTGAVNANLGNAPTYDAENNQVVWNIDRVVATKGILSAPAEAIFQVEATPSIGMAGAPELLINATHFKATDNFTGLIMEVSAIPVTTAMLDDGVSPADSIVVR